ncbi:MAG TPA: Mth938-like domain-containing protein [Casimicrobiaceae bacterium]|nr:Mth938-like domain-containing protein [Casimicrobiaceae bacterium]
MKFHLQAPTANIVTGCGPGWVRVGGDEYRENVVITADGVKPGFARHGFESLSAEDFSGLLESSPEIVLLGTGSTQRFVRPAITAPLHNANVGLEVMDTRAACRTYNILVAEGRPVTAALIVE